jgi:hypothetical protein
MATSTQAQPSTPDVSLAMVRELIDQAAARRPDLRTRLEKAALIVLVRRIERGARGWWVESEAEPGKEYWVLRLSCDGSWQCTCKDWERRRDLCKHILSVRLLEACQRRAVQERRALGRHVRPAPACAPPEGADAPIPYVLTPAGEAAADEPEPIVA